MKTFRLIGMAVLMVLMCGTFVACGGDDDEKLDSGDIGLIVGIWHKVSSCRYEALSFNLDGTYGFYLYSDGRTPETLLESGKYSVNSSKGSITLYNRNYDNNKEKLENEERRFSLSTDNKNLYFEDRLGSMGCYKR